MRARCSARREPGGSCRHAVTAAPRDGRSWAIDAVDADAAPLARRLETPLGGTGRELREIADAFARAAPRAALTSSRSSARPGRQTRLAVETAERLRELATAQSVAAVRLRRRRPTRRSARCSLHWAARTSRPGSRSVSWRTTAHGSPSSWPRPSRSPPGPRTPRTPPSRPAAARRPRARAPTAARPRGRALGRPRVTSTSSSRSSSSPRRRCSSSVSHDPTCWTSGPTWAAASRRLGDPPRRAAADEAEALLDRLCSTEPLDTAARRGSSPWPRATRSSSSSCSPPRSRATRRPPRLDPTLIEARLKPAGRARSRRRRGRCHLRHLVCRRGRRVLVEGAWQPPSWRSSGGG